MVLFVGDYNAKVGECMEIIKKKNEAQQLMIERNTRNNAEIYRQLRREADNMLKKKKES